MARRKAKSSVGTWIVVAMLIFGAAQFFGRDGDNGSAARVIPPKSVVQNQPEVAPRTVLAPTSPKPAPVVRETRYVTASTLNVRQDPTTTAPVLSSIRQGQSVEVLDVRNGWLLIRLGNARQGWISGQYTSSNRPAPVYVPPAALSKPSAAAASGLSCSPRRTCGQISSCSAARWFLQNCSWGSRLDRDNDGRPCEAMC